MIRLAAVAVLAGALSACTSAIRARPTDAFPRTWSDEPDWAANEPSSNPLAAVRVPVAPPRAPAPVPAPRPVRQETAPAPVVASTGPVADRGLVVVLPADVKEAELARGTASAFDESIRTIAGDALSAHGYTVLTGETTLAVLADNGVDAARACEASCALQAARELKARLFVSSTVTRSEGEYVAFVRLFEVATGRQLASVSLEGASVKALRESFSRRADGFFAKALALVR